MDQQVIDAYVTIAVDRLKRHLQEWDFADSPPPGLALILGTVDPFGSALEQPVIFGVTPACFRDPPTDSEYSELLQQAATESLAVAIAHTVHGASVILVEVRGRHEIHQPVDTSGDEWDWSVTNNPEAVNLLPSNRAN